MVESNFSLEDTTSERENIFLKCQWTKTLCGSEWVRTSESPHWPSLYDFYVISHKCFCPSCVLFSSSKTVSVCQKKKKKRVYSIFYHMAGLGTPQTKYTKFSSSLKQEEKGGSANDTISSICLVLAIPDMTTLEYRQCKAPWRTCHLSGLKGRKRELGLLTLQGFPGDNSDSPNLLRKVQYISEASTLRTEVQSKLLQAVTLLG